MTHIFPGPRYSQVRASTGEEAYYEVIPGSFIIRSGCTDIEAKGEQTKIACKERMNKLIGE